MKLVSNFFFNQRIYGVNLKRIDNGPQTIRPFRQNRQFRPLLPEKFLNNLKVGVAGHFL